MSVRTVYFDDLDASVSGIPRAELVVHGPGGPMGSSVRWANVLVDTGAKHTQIPERQARDIGIDPTTGVKVTIQTSNGTASRWLVSLQLEVQGRTVNSVGVYIWPNATPLVGRSALYGAFQTTAITSADWLQEF